MPGELTVPLLYRKILRAAKLFPSIKRNAIIEDIKVEFREGQACANRVTLLSLAGLALPVGASCKICRCMDGVAVAVDHLRCTGCA